MPGAIVILDYKAEMRSIFPGEELFLGRGCQVATATTSKKLTSQLPDRESFSTNRRMPAFTNRFVVNRAREVVVLWRRNSR